jgi:hypothetical protein
MGLTRSVFRATKKLSGASYKMAKKQVVARKPRTLQHSYDAQDVVGESNYQKALNAIGGRRNEMGVKNDEHLARLVPEPKNKYDPKAIAVKIGGKVVGYIPKTDTEDWHPVIAELGAQGQPATCDALLTGGWDRGDGDRGHIGVILQAVPEINDGQS